MKFTHFLLCVVSGFSPQASNCKPLLGYSVVELIALHRHVSQELSAGSLALGAQAICERSMVLDSPVPSLSPAGGNLERSMSVSPPLLSDDLFASPDRGFSCSGGISSAVLGRRNLASPGSVDEDFKDPGFLDGVLRAYVALVVDHKDDFCSFSLQMRSSDVNFWDTKTDEQMERILKCLVLVINLKLMEFSFKGCDRKDEAVAILSKMHEELRQAIDLLGEGFESALDCWLNPY